MGTSDRRATLREGLDSLEEWATTYLGKFYKDKCKVLHPRRHSPGVQHRPGSTWPESSSVERGLGVLMDNKLHWSDDQCAATTSKNMKDSDEIVIRKKVSC